MSFFYTDKFVEKGQVRDQASKANKDINRTRNSAAAKNQKIFNITQWTKKGLVKMFAARVFFFINSISPKLNALRYSVQIRSNSGGGQ